jgi:predicted unusual protein kinase regulating ubiquinone biosynthesis (AarF/ABC1/UbiB family)
MVIRPVRDGELPPRRLPRRAWRLACMVAGERARFASTRAANRWRRREAAARLERHHLESAARTTATLGQLRAGALKLGQMASFLELEAIPAEYRALYQSELAKLREHAPPISWPLARQVLEEEWGAAPGSVLAELSQQPAAAASIGQVHRGRLKDGREVAIKVQYPRVGDALDADLKAMALILRIAQRSAPGLDAREAAAELRTRLMEELDYEREAEHQGAYARAYDGHPFIRVPWVVPELTGRRVLVSEWAEGAHFEQIRDLPQPERDRFAEILVRFYIGQLDVVGRLNGDPHPGNYVLRADGVVVFLDFGAVKVLDSSYRRHQVDNTRAYIMRDRELLLRSMQRGGFIADAIDVDPDVLMRMLAANDGWLLDDRARTFDTDFIRQRVKAIAGADPDVHYLMRHQRLPAEELWNRRMLLGLLAVLGQLNVTGSWSHIMREWCLGDEPTSELGRLEWGFLRGRELARVP